MDKSTTRKVDEILKVLAPLGSSGFGTLTGIEGSGSIRGTCGAVKIK